MRCEDDLNSFSYHLRYCGPLHLTLPGDMADACTNIQQVAEEGGEEQQQQGGDTPHVDTWCSARVWVDFFGSLHWW